MNRQEQCNEDFYKIVERISVWAIKNKFCSNVDALSETGWPVANDYKTLDKFNYFFSIPKSVVKGVFTVKEDGKPITYNWTSSIQKLVDDGKIFVFKHGRFFNKKVTSNRYVLAKSRLKEIFSDQTLLDETLTLSCYTARQKRFITKTILTKMSEQEQQTFINQEKLFKEMDRKRKRRAARCAKTKENNRIAELENHIKELEERMRTMLDSPDELTPEQREYADKVWKSPTYGMDSDEMKSEADKVLAAVAGMNKQNEDIEESDGFDAEFLNEVEEKLKRALLRNLISYGQTQMLIKKICFKDLKMPYREGGYDSCPATEEQKKTYVSFLKTISDWMNSGKISIMHYKNDPPWYKEQKTAQMKFQEAQNYVAEQLHRMTMMVAV